MSENEKQDSIESDALDDDALDGVTGGAGLVVHELTHAVQQGTRVGANETITVGGNQSVSVGTTQK